MLIVVHDHLGLGRPLLALEFPLDFAHALHHVLHGKRVPVAALQLLHSR